MSFLSPIWFFALAALSIPVFIHLWNIRPGKTLKVGSISLITEASKSTRRSFKLLDVLLLILRCLLLALIAFFLAAPAWQHYLNTTKAKGWVLIPKENFKESYRSFKPQIDSLTKAGYEFHYFNKDFPKGELTRVLADTTKDTTSTANYWSLLKQLDKKVPDTLPAYLFSPNNINYFKGEKPAVDLNLKWSTYTPVDSASTWISGAWFTNANAIKVTTGKSGSGGIYFTDEVIQNEGNTDITVSAANGQPVVSLKDQPPIPVDTATLRIAVYTDKYNVDASYLNAALNAVTKFNGRKAIVRQYNNPAQIPGGQTWLFWLSDQSISGSLLNNTANILRYESGKPANVSSWISADDKYTLPNQAQNNKLYKWIASADKAETIWHDGYGKAILGLEKQKGNIYHFYTHFNPAWNDLVWNEYFPKMMLKLISRDAANVPAQYDKRVLTNAQIQPDIIKEGKEIVSTKLLERVDLSKYFWLLLVIVFVAERWLANKNKMQTNG